MFTTVSTLSYSKKKKHDPKSKEITSQQNLLPFNVMVFYKTHATESCGSKLLSSILMPLQGIPEEYPTFSNIS